MDPLSEVLSLLKPQTFAAGGFDVGGELSLRFDAYPGIKCYAVASGECWLEVEGYGEPVLLQAGDCLLMPTGKPFRLTSDLGLESVDAMSYLRCSDTIRGHVAVIQGGGRCMIAGGHFTLSGAFAPMLLGLLDPIVHLQSETDKQALRWSIEQMKRELNDARAGSILIAQQTAYTLLVLALRLHLAAREDKRVGWLYALADKQIGGAIEALHAEPARRWTVQELASIVGMSRSIFAERFKELVGKGPMEYLTKWRMMLAANRLETTRDGVAEIATALGYESESAFSTAFKRVMGSSPRQYCRGLRTVKQAPVLLAAEAAD